MNLNTIQTPSGHFTIAPYDHRGSMAKLLGIDMSTPLGAEVMTQVKIFLTDVFSPICSGVLIDPIFGFPAIAHKAQGCGLLLTLEMSDTPPADVPTMIPNWGVEAVKNNYAVAKLKISYHPAEENAEAKKKLVTELCEYCHHEDIAFLLEPLIFNPAGTTELSIPDFQEAQLQMVREFQQHCDVIKIQYPGNALAAATITAELDVPWVLLSRAMSHEKFVEALKVSMENGASGFAAGRSVWQEIGSYKTADGSPDLTAIQQFLHTTALARMKELIAITEKK